MNDSRLIFDYLRQRKQLYTIVLASFYLSRRVDENSVRIIIETKFDGRRENQFLSALRLLRIGASAHYFLRLSMKPELVRGLDLTKSWWKLAYISF